jgi:hypothetical protein
LFSLKNIGQTFEKSFVFWKRNLANLGETCFLQYVLKTKSSFQQLKYTHTCALGTGFKSKACLTSLKVVTLHIPSSIYERKLETCVPEKKVMNLFSDQEIGKTRMRIVWEECENFREIVKRKGINGFLERSSVKSSLQESVMWWTPIIPCVCHWDGRGFLVGFMRAASSVRKVEKGVRRERVWEFQGDREEERGWCFWGEIYLVERSA